MNTDDKEQILIQQRNRGHNAKQILENPIWSETWERYHETLREQMEDPTVSDEAVLEARRTLICVQRLRADIESTFDSGRIAVAQLERIHGQAAKR